MGVLCSSKISLNIWITSALCYEKEGSCLETLVVEGGSTTVLVPPGRYAVMNNVWCLPSVSAFQTVDGTGRFRQCSLCRYQSNHDRGATVHRLDDMAIPSRFLDVNDSHKTIEGIRPFTCHIDWQSSLRFHVR